MVAQSGCGVDGFDDVAGEVARMAGGEANASDAADLGDGNEQLGERQLPFRVAIAVDVLTEELDLGIAEIGDAARFGKHRSSRSAAFFAARVRNHAIRTELVAALDDGD